MEHHKKPEDLENKKEEHKAIHDHNEKDDQNLIMDYSDVHPSFKRKMERRAEKARDVSDSKRSDIIFYAALGILLIVFASFFALGYYRTHKKIYTIDELHDLNFQGKLDADEGYIYNGIYSFVEQDGFWYTALQSQTGRSLYSFAFRYSPRDLSEIPVSGAFDRDLFNNATEYFITFNPTAENLSYTVLAVNDYNQHMLSVFLKSPIPACDRNETLACTMRPIITCESTEGMVVYVKDDPSPSVRFDRNCIMVLGRGFDQVKGVDLVLYRLYGIME